MNIFVLHSDPVIAAQMTVNKHTSKMCLESAQLLCSCFPIGIAPYKRSHYNHPAAKWTRESSANFDWLIKHAKGLCAEYTYRYGKTHKSELVIDWCRDNKHQLSFPKDNLTEHPQCFGEYFDKCFVPNNPVAGYRNYYKIAKSKILDYTRREKPSWLS